MAVKVIIPAPLRQYSNKQKEIGLNGEKIQDLLNSMKQEYEILYSRICDEGGNLRQYVNLYLNGVDIKKLNHIQTPLQENDTLTIIPAVAGGNLKSEIESQKKESTLNKE